MTLRSGTSRTYEQRAKAGRPNRTFALAIDVDKEIGRLAEALGLSRSQVVSLGVRVLAEDPNAQAKAAAFLAEDKKK
jgi:hypothetical protein